MSDPDPFDAEALAQEHNAAIGFTQASQDPEMVTPVMLWADTTEGDVLVLEWENTRMSILMRAGTLRDLADGDYLIPRDDEPE